MDHFFNANKNHAYTIHTIHIIQSLDYMNFIYATMSNYIYWSYLLFYYKHLSYLLLFYI